LVWHVQSVVSLLYRRTIECPGARKDIKSIAISYNSNRIVTCSPWRVHILNMEDGSILGVLALGSSSSGILISRDGTRIVAFPSCDDSKALHVWDANTGAVISTVPVRDDLEYVRSVAISNDGARVMCSDSIIGICSWDPENSSVEHNSNAGFGRNLEWDGTTEARVLKGNWHSYC